MSRKETTHKYFEIEVSLVGAEPKVWRQFLIHKYSTFGDLHKAIQVACGWQDYHLYSFSELNPYSRHDGDNTTFAISPHDEAEGYSTEPQYADKLRLTWIFDDDCVGREIFYLYDYGDGWIHSVKMIGFHKLEEKFKRRLIAGGRAFPLEDSGALRGYQRCVDAYYDPENAEDDLLLWMGDWNPEHFDLKKAKSKFNLPRKKNADLYLSPQEPDQVADGLKHYNPVNTNVVDIRAKLAANRKDKNT
jgi:Plasmid pRiA4b ORF-3-like protein